MILFRLRKVETSISPGAVRLALIIERLAPWHGEPNYSQDVLFFCTIPRRPEAF